MDSHITNVFYGHCCCEKGNGSSSSNNGDNGSGTSTGEGNIINDSIISREKTWSSEKIKGEIKVAGATRLQDLQDVDVLNKRHGQVIGYNEQTNKFVAMDMEMLQGGTEGKINQVCKLGIIGTGDKPSIIDIPIASTDEFILPKINILKFKPEGEEDFQIINTFDDSEKYGFKDDNMVVFNGSASLKTEHDIPLNYGEDIYPYKSYVGIVDKSIFKTINSIAEKEIKENVLTINAIPKDRLLIQTEDFNVLSSDYIKDFNITATNGVKIVCSSDSGVTFKTFKNNHWVDTDLTLEKVIENGIDIDIFNAITSEQWRALITNKKIRFAYLLTDNNYIDEIKTRFTRGGYWVDAKDSEYDIVYVSKDLIQLHAKFSGDIKINY